MSTVGEFSQRSIIPNPLRVVPRSFTAEFLSGALREIPTMRANSVSGSTGITFGHYVIACPLVSSAFFAAASSAAAEK